MSNIIDFSVIDGLKEIGDQEFVSELIEMFLQQSDIIMEDIDKYTEQKDADSLSKSAHKLKGSCLNLGAVDMGKICQVIEHKGRENNIENIELQVMELKNIYTETCNELKKLM